MIIKDMTENEYQGKAYVHHTSWMETYKGLMNDEFLSTRSIEKSINIAKKYPENTIVAIIDDKVVGFAAYNHYRDEDVDAGEVMAIYVLKAYQKQGIGKALMDECFNRLIDYKTIYVWVLKSNSNSIHWYENYGFKLEEVYKSMKVMENYALDEIRMVFKRS